MIFVKIESIDVNIEFHEKTESDSRSWERVDKLSELIVEGSINSCFCCLGHWTQ